MREERRLVDEAADFIIEDLYRLLLVFSLNYGDDLLHTALSFKALYKPAYTTA